MLGSVGGDLKSLDLTSSTFLGWVPPSLEQVPAVDVVKVVVVVVVVIVSVVVFWVGFRPPWNRCRPQRHI